MGDKRFSGGSRGRVAAALTAIAAICLVAPARAAAQSTPWHYRADWSRGFAGWMSFPLAQDVGYDPTLYTETRGPRTLLLRNVLSHGEPRLWIGFVRPLKFQAGPQSSYDVDYELNAAGPMRNMELMLGASDGHHYSFPIPATNGEHQVHISGAQLGLRAPTAIDVIILRGVSMRPPAGSRTQWVLENFAVSSSRRPTVSLRKPATQLSSDGGQVSREALEAGQPLQLEWEPAEQPTRISLFSPSGEKVLTKDISAGVQEAKVPLPFSAAGLWCAEVTQGDARTEFNFLVLGTVAPHPRLLLNDERLRQLQGPDYAELRKQIHSRAESLAAKITYSTAAGDNIEAMPVGTGIDAAYPNEITPYFQLMDSYSQTVAYNALDYRLNGNIKALDAARRALLTMTQWTTWVPRRFDSHGVQTYYEVGVATQLVAFGYDLIAEQLSPQDKATVEQAFWKQVVAPTVQEYFVADRDPIAASNWMANSLGGALAAAVAVAGDTPAWTQRDAPAIAELEFAFERLIHGLFPGDGSEAEPLGYENFALQGLSWGTSALAALGIKPQGEQQMLEGFWWPYYVTVAPGMQLDTGDFNGHLTKLPGFAWGAEHSGIPELRAFYENNAGRPDLSKGAPVGNNGHFLEEMPGPLDLACCTGPAPAFQPPPVSRIFAKRGSAVLRSGWDADATVISLRAGPWFNHEHHDQGSFQVAAFGQKLVTEAGYAHYYLDPHYRDYFTQAPGHNTVLVDGNPYSQQTTNGRYWPGLVHPGLDSEMLTPGFDYLRADLTSAYDGALKSYAREYFFLKPGLLVIRDRIHAEQPHTYSWLLHVPAGAALASETTNASIQTPHASAALLAIGENTRWSSEDTPLPISDYENLDKPRIQPRRELVLNSIKTPSTQFIVAMNIERGAKAEQDSIERWSDSSGVGVRTKGDNPASLVFRTGPGMLTIGNISTDGSALMTTAAAEWSAVEARVVEVGGRDQVRSASPIDIVMEHRNAGIAITVHNNVPDQLQISAATSPKEVRVDGQRVAVKYESGRLELPLSRGEHHVSIQ